MRIVASGSTRRRSWIVEAPTPELPPRIYQTIIHYPRARKDEASNQPGLIRAYNRSAGPLEGTEAKPRVLYRQMQLQSDIQPYQANQHRQVKQVEWDIRTAMRRPPQSSMTLAFCPAEVHLAPRSSTYNLIIKSNAGKKWQCNEMTDLERSLPIIARRKAAQNLVSLLVGRDILSDSFHNASPIASQSRWPGGNVKPRFSIRRRQTISKASQAEQWLRFCRPYSCFQSIGFKATALILTRTSFFPTSGFEAGTSSKGPPFFTA